MFDLPLQTKLFSPPARPNLVSRPRLLEQLALQPQTKLLLISAPAGYGKTTLVTSWLAQLDNQTPCWLSLDEEESSLPHFFRYLAAAIQPHFATPALNQLLQASPSQPFPPKTWVKTLIQDLYAISAPFLLILDDYHVIDSAEVDAAVAALLAWQPPHMRLIMTSRNDPAIPLAKLRARGQLIELRAEELRFTQAEVAQFLQQAMGLTLTVEQVGALEARTEGWIAGLQMAALSMQNRPADDLDQFVTHFAGSHRFVFDYLAEETVRQQPEHIQSFLLRTAILERLSGPLCTAVSGQENSQAILEQLERDNLFVIPLDDQRRWYRYHHLFADVLRAYGQNQLAQELPELHRRASHWFDQAGRQTEAIRHAFAAPDLDQAAHLIERAWRSMDRSFQEKRWLSWASRLPAEVIRARPVLSAGTAWALLDTGQHEAAQVWLQQAEQWLENPTAEMLVSDQETFAILPATLAAARTYLAQAQGDLAATRRHAQQALTLIPEDDHFYRGVPTVTLGMALWEKGNLVEAQEAFRAGIAYFNQADNWLFAASGMAVLAEITAILGHLHESARMSEQAIEQNNRHGAPLFQTLATLHRGLSLVRCIQGDLDAAQHHLAQSTRQSDRAGKLGQTHRHAVATAMLAQATGDLAGALTQLDKAATIVQPGRMAEAVTIEALRCRIWLAQGKIDLAEQWASQRAISPTDPLSFLQEHEHLTYARLLLSIYLERQDEAALMTATTLLTRLLEAAQLGQRRGSEIEILLLQARLEKAVGHDGEALSRLEQALQLAQPEGYVLPFVDGGQSVAQLIQTAVRQEILPNFGRSLLAAFETHGRPLPAPAAQPLVEPLSERELEVLQLIAAGFKNKEIANQLFISLNTVLYHNKNIYGKLNVRQRTQAIAKARRLGLL